MRRRRARTTCRANWVFNWFVKQFNDKWNSVNPTGFVEFKTFVPLAGGVPINYKPANGALGVGTSVTLDWDGGNWNHRYDVYLGTDPTNLSRVGENLPVGSPYTGRHETWAVPAGLCHRVPSTTGESSRRPWPTSRGPARRGVLRPPGRDHLPAAVPSLTGDGHGANTSLAGVERRGGRDPVLAGAQPVRHDRVRANRDDRRQCDELYR